MRISSSAFAASPPRPLARMALRARSRHDAWLSLTIRTLSQRSQSMRRNHDERGQQLIEGLDAGWQRVGAVAAPVAARTVTCGACWR